MPKITVLLPFYNAEKYLAEAIESILSQTYRDFELLLIDDGSTDGSVAIVQGFSDARIRLEKNGKNLGLVKTLNRGLDLASGELIARMDADDISVPNRLDLQVRFMDANPEITVLGGAYETIEDPPRLISHPLSPSDIRRELLFTGSVLAHPTVVMRKLDLRKLGATYDSRFEHAEDYGLWAFLSGQSKLANLPDLLVRYRCHVDQISIKKKSIQQKSTARVKAKLLSDIIGEDHGKDLFLPLFGGKIAENSLELRAIASAARQVQKKNQVSGNFPDKELSELILHHWSLACMSSDVKGFQMLADYFSYEPTLKVSKANVRRWMNLIRHFVGLAIQPRKEMLRDALKKWLQEHPARPVNVHIFGPLGDQLFLYALGIHLEQIKGEAVFFDISGYQRFKRYRRAAIQLKKILPSFHFYKLNFGRGWISDLVKLIYENGSANFRKIRFLRDGMQLQKRPFGYTEVYEGPFRSFEIFKESGQKVRDAFKFDSAIKSKKLLDLQARIPYEKSVAVIVSKSKYDLRALRVSGPQWASSAGADFYRASIEAIKQKIAAPQFYLFCEDPRWAYSFLPELNGMELVPDFSEDSIEHLALLSSYRSYILTSDSFGRWGAWLNNDPQKIVIAAQERELS
jgi:glycosyltransferase involved in cell wall biosynthesis